MSYAFGTFIVMTLRGNLNAWLGCTKTQSSEIGTVLHKRPPNVHIFDTNSNLADLNSLVFFTWL